MSEADSYEARFEKGAEAIDDVQKAVRLFFEKKIIFDEPSRVAAEQVTLSEGITSMTIRTFMEQYLDPMVFDLMKKNAPTDEHTKIDKLSAQYQRLLKSLKNLTERGNKKYIEEIWKDIKIDYSIEGVLYPGTLSVLSAIIFNQYSDLRLNPEGITPELKFLCLSLEECSQAFSLSVGIALGQNHEALGLNPGSEPEPPRR